MVMEESRCEAVSPGAGISMLTLRGKSLLFWAKAAHSSGHLPSRTEGRDWTVTCFTPMALSNWPTYLSTAKPLSTLILEKRASCENRASFSRIGVGENHA